jgi:hypothetical protein
MAEFLIRVRNKPDHNEMLLSAGDVVVVCEDGWPWSDIERKSPDWRIVAVPGLPLAAAERWVAQELVDEKLFLKRRRHFKLDLALIDQDQKDGAWLKDDARKAEVVIHDDVTKFESYFKAREPLSKEDATLGVAGVKDIPVSLLKVKTAQVTKKR